MKGSFTIVLVMLVVCVVLCTKTMHNCSGQKPDWPTLNASIRRAVAEQLPERLRMLQVQLHEMERALISDARCGSNTREDRAVIDHDIERCQLLCDEIELELRSWRCGSTHME